MAGRWCRPNRNCCRTASIRPKEFARWWPWLLCGLVIAAGVLALRNRPRLLAGLALPFWLLCALLGGVLVFLWGFSIHLRRVGKPQPAAAFAAGRAALPGAIALLRRRLPGRMFSIMLWLLAGRRWPHWCCTG